MSVDTAREAVLPQRAGTRPRITPATPHMQLDQMGPKALHDDLWRRMAGLDGIRSGHSGISEIRTRALHLDPRLAQGPRDAFLVGTEFAHLHGDGSGSLHLALPPRRAEEAMHRGWAEPHPVVAMGYGFPTWVMLYGPRDDDELTVLWHLVLDSHAYARGQI